MASSRSNWHRQPHLCHLHGCSANRDGSPSGVPGRPHGIGGGARGTRAGIRTPALIAFDDSRELIDRPYSLWERVPGRALGLYAPEASTVLGTWAEIGREIAHHHLVVTECPDPNGWLESHEHGDPRIDFAEAAKLGKLEPRVARRLEAWIQMLEPLMATPAPTRFLHGDLHDMNVMCDDEGAFRALIDWGDAGWSDPAADFADIPLAALTTTVSAYEDAVPALLGNAGIPSGDLVSGGPEPRPPRLGATKSRHRGVTRLPRPGAAGVARVLGIGKAALPERGWHRHPGCGTLANKPCSFFTKAGSRRKRAGANLPANGKAIRNR